MKGWEPKLPSGFPIDRLAGEAVRAGEARKLRRLQRNQRVLSGVCVFLLVSMVALVVGRENPFNQLEAGSGRSSESGDVGVDVAVTARNGKVAFIRSTGPNGGPPSAIWVMNDDGSGQAKVADTTQGSSLAWSPDGTRLAFQDVGGIYTINADGTGETRLVGTSNGESWPAWSPDGTKLAFRSLTAGGIVVANVDGTGRRTVTKDDVASPAWSPDGRRLAYSRSGHIYVVNVDGTGEKRLPTTDGFEDSPTWSPDGRQIAFRSNSTISVVDLDGGRARALASPGGTALVNPQGKGADKLATPRGDPSTPQWSPDGSKIVFAVYQTGEACSIWIMSADGSVQTQITDNRTCDRDPAWQPLKP
jgi:Tol biopolymer transport system component